MRLAAILLSSALAVSAVPAFANDSDSDSGDHVTKKVIIHTERPSLRHHVSMKIVKKTVVHRHDLKKDRDGDYDGDK